MVGGVGWEEGEEKEEEERRSVHRVRSSQAARVVSVGGQLDRYRREGRERRVSPRHTAAQHSVAGCRGRHELAARFHGDRGTVAVWGKMMARGGCVEATRDGTEAREMLCVESLEGMRTRWMAAAGALRCSSSCQALHGDYANWHWPNMVRHTD